MPTTDYRSAIGKIVRRERLKQGWTQEELAEKIDIHPSFVGQIERGIKAASLDTLKRLGAVFGIKSAEFLNEGEENAPRRETQPVEQKILNLLKGCTTHEQEAVYQTIRYLLRKKRKLAK